MSQRNTYTRSSSTRGRTPQKATPKRTSAPRHNQRKGGSGNIGWVLLIIVIVVALVLGMPYIKDFLNNTVSSGDANAINFKDMTQEEAYAIVSQAANDTLDKISVTFTYNDKSWEFGEEELQATVDIQTILNKAYESDRNGFAIKQYQSGEDLASLEQLVSSSVIIDKEKLVIALGAVQSEIDNPVIEPTISFDPSNYNYFDPESNSRDMFVITEGQIGYEMDYDDALQKLNDALEVGWTANIPITVIEAHPTITAAELEGCTTLIFHSSSQISSTNKQNANRTHNIAKAIGYYKGLVLMPGEYISYNETLGERTIRNGWLEAPTINQEKELEDALGGGICQSATTIFNAAFRGGANILEHVPHSWPAYYQDFGYGMDAMVNWGTDDLIFRNDTEYPMFFNTYFWYDKYGVAGYIDVDVYTMPEKDENGNVLHLRPEPNIIERTAPEAPLYYEDTENKYADKTWTVDTTLNKLIYVKRSPRELVKVSVDKVWYKDCVETSLGVFDGGVEVKREYSHTYTYNSVQAIIYTKPIPVVTPTPEPTPDGGASG